MVAKAKGGAAVTAPEADPAEGVEPLVGVKVAAKILGCSTTTVLNRLVAEGLKKYRIGDRDKFLVSEVLAFRKSREQRIVPGAPAGDQPTRGPEEAPASTYTDFDAEARASRRTLKRR